ncbi:MAG: UDP-glucose/GDP-mannose dehydrogenase family protein [Patescibacteria group bacterium]
MKVVVIGTGYVGLVQGACLAHLGHQVWCVDIDESKVAKLKQGQVPIFEVGLPELVGEGIENGRLQFTISLEDALSGEVPAAIFIGVPTPYAQDGSCDLSYIEAVCHDLGKVLDSSTLVVIKSTVPPGTNKKIKQWLGRDDIEVASNPEFLREGSAVKDFLKPDRILIGVESDRARDILVALHRGIDATMFVASPETAQLAKYANNTFLASRLSLINEVANIADLVGADIKDIERIIGSDPRIGDKFMRAGAGFGGSCFPKDVLALEHTARQHGYIPRLIQPIIELNRDQPHRFVDLVVKRLGGVQGKKIAVWGLAFNKDTDDTRESPAISIIHRLLDHGATIHVFDPRAMVNARNELGERVEYLSSAMNVVVEADALLVLTEWPEFLDTRWDQVKEHLKQPLIFDGKNYLPHTDLRNLGFEIQGIGLFQQRKFE